MFYSAFPSDLRENLNKVKYCVVSTQEVVMVILEKNIYENYWICRLNNGPFRL